MNGFILDLFLGSAHEISDSGFSIFCPVGFDVLYFHREQFSVEPMQVGHQEVFFALDPEVVVGEVKSPGVGSSLRKHEEIFSTRDETQGNESS